MCKSESGGEIRTSENLVSEGVTVSESDSQVNENETQENESASEVRVIEHDIQVSEAMSEIHVRVREKSGLTEIQVSTKVTL